MTDEPEIVGAWRELIEARGSLVQEIESVANDAKGSPEKERSLRERLRKVDEVLEAKTLYKSGKRALTLRTIRKLTDELRGSSTEEARALIEDYLVSRGKVDDLDRHFLLEATEEELCAMFGLTELSLETLIQQARAERNEARRTGGGTSGTHSELARKVVQRLALER